MTQPAAATLTGTINDDGLPNPPGIGDGDVVAGQRSGHRDVRQR